MIAGSIVALYHAPSRAIQSTILHFAGGIVVAAVATQLIPLVIKQAQHLPLYIGFLTGSALMLTLEGLQKYVANHHLKGLPIGFLILVSVDLCIDGLLLGACFTANTKSGSIIALALSLETLFLGLALIHELSSVMRKQKSILTITLISLLIPISSLIGFYLLGMLSHHWLTGLISFGVAAFLYLAIELITKAHQVKDTPFTISAFFLGFLMILVIG
jgi:zinc transporter, ZIP family